MKKSMKHLLILVLGFVLIVSLILFGYVYPFGGISLSIRINYPLIHKKDLHLSNANSYKLIEYRVLNEFSSFAVLEFDKENDLSDLELIYAKDDNIQRFMNLYDSSSSSVSLEYIDYLPIDINCDCYTLFVINEFKLTYLYQVYFYQNKMYIYYTSR